MVFLLCGSQEVFVSLAAPPKKGTVSQLTEANWSITQSVTDHTMLSRACSVVQVTVVWKKVLLEAFQKTLIMSAVVSMNLPSPPEDV